VKWRETQPHLRPRAKILRGRTPLLLFFLALTIRLVFVLSLGADLMKPLRDQRLYLRMGQSVANGEGLILKSRVFRPPEDENLWKLEIARLWVDFEDPGMGVAREGQPTAIIEPLYPLFLGLLEIVSSSDIVLIRMIQVLLAGLTALLIFLIGQQVAPRVGIWAAIGFSFYPHLVYYTGIVSTETMYIFLQILAVWLWTRWLTAPSARRAALFGFAAAFAFLTRSSMLPVAFVAVLVASVARRSVLKTLPLTLLGFVLVCSPWMVRNGIELGEFRLLPTKSGLNLWMQNHPDLQQLQLTRIGMPISHRMFEGLQCRELERFPAFPDSVREVERNRILTEQAMEYIRCNPGYFAHMCWTRLCWYMKLTGTTIGGGRRVIDAVGATSFVLLLTLGAQGSWFGRRSPIILAMLAIYVAYLFMHTLFHGGVRYRIPADTLMLLPAALALESIASKLRPSQR